MRIIYAIGMLSLVPGCGLYFGNSSGGGPGSGDHSGDLYHLSVARSVAAEGEIRGVDADQNGALWIAYATDGNYMQNVKPVVTLVHWDPSTRQRLATFTYNDLWSPVSGVALVHGSLWLNYEDITADAVIRTIDPASGAITSSFGTTGIELSAMASDRALISNDGVDVIDASTGGVEQEFSSATVVDPSDMGGISFSGTQQGIAWRPGEIWVASWYLPLEVFSESGQVLGTIDLPDLRSDSAWPTAHLAFDRGQLLVGRDGELTWYDVH